MIHPSVRIHATALIGHVPMYSPALAREPARTLEEVEIGAGTVIGPYAVIYLGVRIGQDCLVGDYASIRENTRIGDRCVVGRQVTVNYDVEIEDDVRLQDFTHITGGCRIGAGSFFGPGVLTSNDRRVDLVDYHFPGAQPPVFGRRVMVGTGANILAGVTIGDDALIAAGALVVHDVPARTVVKGPVALSYASPIA